MQKYVLLGLFCCLGLSLSAHAQQAFWNYDDQGHESTIPVECDGRFDEEKGDVILPTAEELRLQGEKFLLETDPAERNKAGYCLIAAALQGDVDAQYRIAQLYNKGVVLPQDELSAYRWAFTAALNGHEQADRLALLLERFLTTEDIRLATESISGLLPTIQEKHQKALDEKTQLVSEKQAALDEINAEIDEMLGIDTSHLDKKRAEPMTADMPELGTVPDGEKGDIFNAADRL